MLAFRHEVAEAEVEVVVANGDPDVFGFSKLDFAGAQWMMSPGSYAVTVTCGNLEPVIYRGGSGRDWVSQFRDDLRAGRFVLMPAFDAPGATVNLTAAKGYT